MIDKKKLYENLSDFIDAVATEEPEAERNSMKMFIGGKTEQVLEFAGDSKIKLDGDDVMVGGTKVGEVTSDLNDTKSGIQFEADDGTSQEFNTLEELYSHLAEKYNVKEASKKLSEETDLDEDFKAGASKAISKQATKRSERAKRFNAVRGRVEKDGKEGEYDGGDKGDYTDPEKGNNAAAHSGGEADLKTSGGHDSHDIRKSHTDSKKS